MEGVWNSHLQLVEMQSGIITLQNSLAALNMVKYRVQYGSATPQLCIYKYIAGK